MSYSNALDYLIAKYEENRKTISDHLTRGNPASVKDYSEYQRLCGVVQGLDFAIQAVIDLADRLERDDE